MNDFEIVDLAFDILDEAEVVQELEKEVLIKVNKQLWDKFQEAMQ